MERLAPLDRTRIDSEFRPRDRVPAPRSSSRATEDAQKCADGRTVTINDAGLWCEVGRTDFGGRAALFLDRDGVIVEDTNYLGRVEDVRMIEGAASAITRCNLLGIAVVVVTNQSGIARGYYGWEGFQAVQGAIGAVLAQAGAHLDAVLACAYHGDGREPLRVANHPWRKPNPGMITAAATDMNLDIARSWIVGDQPHDLAAGAAAGLAGGTLLTASSSLQKAATALASSTFKVEIAANLAEAVAGLLESRLLADGV
jgi:D-glycero-D-manno-heptose 1,7-bisphosphate phosphatase